MKESAPIEPDVALSAAAYFPAPPSLLCARVDAHIPECAESASPCYSPLR